MKDDISTDCKRLQENIPITKLPVWKTKTAHENLAETFTWETGPFVASSSEVVCLRMNPNIKKWKWISGPQLYSCQKLQRVRPWVLTLRLTFMVMLLWHLNPAFRFTVRPLFLNLSEGKILMLTWLYMLDLGLVVKTSISQTTTISIGMVNITTDAVLLGQHGTDTLITCVWEWSLASQVTVMIPGVTLSTVGGDRHLIQNCQMYLQVLMLLSCLCCWLIWEKTTKTIVKHRKIHYSMLRQIPVHWQLQAALQTCRGQPRVKETVGSFCEVTQIKGADKTRSIWCFNDQRASWCWCKATCNYLALGYTCPS